MGKRISKAARRWLLTFQPEPFAWAFNTTGGRWAVQRHALTSKVTVRHFVGPNLRDGWVKQNPSMRSPVGKRHPRVKAYRNGRNHGRADE